MARKGKTAAAIECFERAISLNPNYSEAYNNLGIAVISANRPRGIECFQIAVRLDPRNTEALANLGNALAQEGQYSEAIRYYELALAIDPDMQQARRSMAAVRQMERQGIRRPVDGR
jgi:superkiller protein 3